MTVVLSNSDTKTPKRPTAKKKQKAPSSSKRVRKQLHEESVTIDTSMNEAQFQIVPLAPTIGSSRNKTSDVSNVHGLTIPSTTMTKESDCMRELASIVPSHFGENASPLSLFPPEREDYHHLDISHGDDNGGKNKIATDVSPNIVESHPDQAILYRESSVLVPDWKKKYPKRFPQRAQEDSTLDLAWQCLGISEGKTLYWNGFECLFYSSSRLPQETRYMAQFNPFIQILNKIRKIILNRGPPSLYLQGLFCGIQDQLRLFEKDVTKLIASNSVSHFSLASLKFHYLPIMQLLLRILHDADNLSGGKILFICSEMHIFATKKCQAIISDLTSKVTVPFFRIMRSWLYTGELSDPFNDFFIRAGLPMFEAGVCRWDETFFLDIHRAPPDWIPGIRTVFISSLLHDILLVGKTAHFLCKIKPWNEPESDGVALQSLPVDDDWSEYIRQRKHEVTHRLLRIYETEYRIDDHIRLCMDYLLFQNSGFADSLCGTLMCSPESKDDLGKKMQNILSRQLCTTDYSTRFSNLPQFMELKIRDFQRSWHKKFAVTREIPETTQHYFFAMPYLTYVPHGHLSMVFTSEICDGLSEIHVFLLRIKLIVHSLEIHWKCPQILHDFSRQVNAVYHKCIQFIRKVHHFIYTDILGPHVAALHLLIQGRKVIEESGYIEGMRLILKSFVQQVQACFLISPPGPGLDGLCICTSTKLPCKHSVQKKS